MRTISFLTVFLLAGCIDRDQDAADQGERNPTGADFDRAEACGPLLPLGIRLDERFGFEGHARRVLTMREKLARIGARVEGAEIVDRTGRRVLFWRASGYGTTPPPGALERERQEIERLRSQGHLIVLYWTTVPN
jgi:hypothetical protein